MNNFNIPEEKQNALLQMAAKQLGTDPAALKAQLQSGQLDNLTKNMDAKTAAQIGSFINNPKAMQALLANDKIKAMLGSLGKK